ncbi:MAG: pilus assembly protein [Proteobacteria bacterium]|nr:pilus assembly protein [Pseudomonadota bacterium]MCH7956655.1 pilus assembly protein [Pseudomonadota bacterium]MCH8212786.1 pilus assembly protein [Pseudomonadota bacterium]
MTRDGRGNAVVEFALVLPLLLLLFAGISEIGRAYYQANAVEKGLRAGALFAGRNDFPLTAQVRTMVANLVKTGTLDGSGPYLVSGWADVNADLNIDDTLTFPVDATTTIPVVRVTATVPFDPLIPGMLTLVGLGDVTIQLSHEQAYVGN